MLSTFIPLHYPCVFSAFKSACGYFILHTFIWEYWLCNTFSTHFTIYCFLEEHMSGSLFISLNFISFYLTFHRSTKTIASLGYRTCPEYTIGYINYISLWIQTYSKSYISVIGYSRGTKCLYNKIHRTIIVAKLTVTNIATNRGTRQIRMSNI